MRTVDGRIVLSASDLTRFQGCAHASALDLRLLRGEALIPAADSEEAGLLQAMGHAHEAAHLDRLRADGRGVAVIDADRLSFAEAAAATRTAIAAGVPVVYQAALGAGPWAGYADFLERVERPSRLGGWSYEVVDTKLKRTPAPTHLLQLCLYADLLAEVLGTPGEHVHVELGDGTRASLRVTDHAAYTRRMRTRLEAFVADPWPTRPEPIAACGFCRWREHCAEEWDRTDSLCLVADSRRTQRRKLEAAGIATIAALAGFDGPVRRLAPATLDKLRAQARLQHARRVGGPPHFELRPAEPGHGLLRLPRPDPGDLYFDMEGDPHVPGGLEYLFGLHWVDGEAERYEAIWAHDPEAERTAVEAVLQRLAEQLARHPGAHVYHYNHYEVTALKRLASRYGIGETLLDQMLRRRRFVDLYRVVRQGLFASEPGYSLKDLEAFYMPGGRGDGVTTAGDSVVAYARYRETGDPAILEAIRAYNETDCRSTRGLRDWLVGSVRPPDWPWFDAPAALDAPVAEDDPVEQDRARLRARIDAADPPLDPRIADLLFELAFFHHREARPGWWAVFDRAERESEELIDDLDSLAGLEAIGPELPGQRSVRRRYRFPDQETKLRSESSARMREGIVPVRILEMDPEAQTVEVKFGSNLGYGPETLDLIPHGPINDKVLRQAIRRVIDDAVAGAARYRAAFDLLHRAPPRLSGRREGDPIRPDGAPLVDSSVAATRALDHGCLPIQGPPGTGKTFVSARAIVQLLRAGKRVGVASHSHKAIDNLMNAVAEAAGGFDLRAVKAGGKDEGLDPRIRHVKSNTDSAISGYRLVGGTAWLFARDEHDQAFDHLFVDEAGQVSLANMLALATAARNLVLVGDPMQLAQPIQGAHPGETGQSALEYLLAGRATVPPDRGIFLDRSWRMHPAVCRYISELVYEGRLESDAATARQAILVDGGTDDLGPHGIRFVAVDHEGNAQSSEEEAEIVVALHRRLLGRRFRDRRGQERPIGLDDVLVVAPYNAQVNLLTRRLPKGARVGTVDRFQGQEAPVCLVSMATSSGDDLPRDIEFLFSTNRLNVAVSRAQALAVMVAGRRLLDVPCRTVEQMRLVNALCALREHAGPDDSADRA